MAGDFLYTSAMSHTAGRPTALFDGYRIGAAFDEMFSAPMRPRPHYKRLHEHLAGMATSEFHQRQQAADLAYLRQGITFNDYRDELGLERPFPVDLVPRIIDAQEWSRLEAGLKQRVHALNLFVHDVYHEQRILRQSVVPLDLVFGTAGYRPELRGIKVPNDVYLHISGIDLIRDTDGSYTVLEDNVRCPSGVSYVLENRRVMKHVLPNVFDQYDVRPVNDYPQRLREVLDDIAPKRGREPVIVVLTPGINNSAYFEHSFLAGQMGVQLVEGQDLVVDGGLVHMRTTRGLRRVDVIYRRIDDDFLDPVSFRADSALGVAGLVGVFRLGGVGLANGIGVGVADNKAVYHYVPAMIKYYLGEEPILANVPTYMAGSIDDRAYILEHLAELVVKAVDQSGGYGMLIGPHATSAERSEFRERIRCNPHGYIAQPTIQLSTHPTFVGDGMAGRHVDLRPFVLYGRDITVLPGGLTRVALRSGSLVVNSSQGGGSKDTWVLAGDGTSQC
ncbi:MAG: hypothetical protein JWO42_23 [Chloroflexi bacterium]|nr:hypothetical protein [Chloroflexota bacterium]